MLRDLLPHKELTDEQLSEAVVKAQAGDQVAMTDVIACFIPEIEKFSQANNDVYCRADSEAYESFAYEAIMEAVNGFSDKFESDERGHILAAIMKQAQKQDVNGPIRITRWELHKEDHKPLNFCGFADESDENLTGQEIDQIPLDPYPDPAEEFEQDQAQIALLNWVSRTGGDHKKVLVPLLIQEGMTNKQASKDAGTCRNRVPALALYAYEAVGS